MIDCEVRFQSIRQTAHGTGLPESYLRKRVKAGTVPGIYSGKKFLINVPALLERLNTEGAGGKTNDNQPV